VYNCFFCDFSTTLQICIIFHVNNNDVTHDVSLILAKSTINKQENCRANSLKLLDPPAGVIWDHHPRTGLASFT